MINSLRNAKAAVLLCLSLTLPTVLAADPGTSDNTYKLGMSAPLSGPNGSYGKEMKEVISAYFEQVNKSGGINGRKLELVALDDCYETDRTVANAKTLIQEKKVFALLGFYGSSPTTEAMNNVFGPARVPLVGTISGADSLRQSPSTAPNNRYMFNVRASYADETEAIVTQMLGLGLKKIAVLYQNDGFGKSGLAGVTQALKKHKLAPVAVASIERNSVEVSEAANLITKAAPQAIVMVTLYKPTSAFVKALRATGQGPMFLTLSPVGAEQLAQDLGESARGIGITQVMPYPWDDTVPIVRDYRHLLGKNAAFGYYGLEAYITARVMIEGLKRIGKDPTREKLVTALESLSNFDLGGYRINFGPDNRLGSRLVELTVIGANGHILK